MLTNKQLWRKQIHVFQGMNLRRSFSDDSTIGSISASMDACTDSEMSDLGERNSSALSLDSVSGECSPELPVQYTRSADNLKSLASAAKKIKKKLCFDNLVRVTLIPSINEYKDAGLHSHLWCSQMELQCYKDSAYQDIKAFMSETQCENFTVAMKEFFKTETQLHPEDLVTTMTCDEPLGAAATRLSAIPEESPEKTSTA
mmetsp:Transcript_40054/g.69347  ORF Transcript_40054/g.69347 Transcript_40054/m.69347 type:complete len:201 (-) Transcript_40054:473-1075(-)